MEEAMYYHINIPGTCYTFTTTDHRLAAYHESQGATVWQSNSPMP
jgi:hypothetical protein